MARVLSHRRMFGVDWLVFGVAIGISLLFLIFGKAPALQVARSEGRDIASFFLQPFRFIPEMFTLWHDNQMLRELTIKLVAENSRLREAAFENERLRGMIDFRKVTPWPLVSAEVIGHPGPGIGGGVILNVGARQGVKRNAAVISPRGLVGKVVRVAPHTCVVQTIRGRNFGVSLTIERTRVQGILKWLEADEWILDGVPTGAEVTIGDVAITTGQGDVFPAGIRTAVVSELPEEPREQFKDVRVQPLANLQTIEEVFVIIPIEETDEEGVE
jgi:rod shape-determining protein MreC